MDDLKFGKFVIALMVMAAGFAYANMWQVLFVLTLITSGFVVVRILRIFFLNNSKSKAERKQRYPADGILCYATLVACFLFFTLIAFISAK